MVLQQQNLLGSQGAGCEAEQPDCVGELGSSLSDADISFYFGRIWKGLLQKYFRGVFSAVLPSWFHCSLSSAQPTLSGTSAAKGTAERMHLTLVWLCAAVPVLLQHP